MSAATPVFLDPSQIHFAMPVPLPAAPTPSPEPTPSKSRLLEILKILVGLIIALILGGILVNLLFVPRTSNGIDLRESNEKIARLQRESNENIARLQRELQIYLEKERLTRQENLTERHRLEDRSFDVQRFERQVFIESQRIERQQTLTEKHRLEDRLINEEHHKEDLFIQREALNQKIEMEKKRLQILLEDREIAERHRNEDLSKVNADLLANFIEQVMSTKPPLNAANFESKIHSLIRRFDSIHKSLLISFLYKIKFLNTDNPNNPILYLEGANLKDLDLDDMNIESGQSVWLNYNHLLLPLTNLINSSFEQIYLNQANFSLCKLMGASFRWSQAIQTDFSGSDLSLSNFHFTNVSKSNFSNTKIQRATFQDAILSQAQMDKADVQSTNFQQSTAIQTNFSHTILSYANFQYANLYQAQMVYASIGSANFFNIIGVEIDFSGAYMSECRFQWANLTNATFRYTFLTGSNFDSADVRNADFTGATLRGVNITSQQLDVVLSIANAFLPDGSIGKNKNLVKNGNAQCTGTNGPTLDWINSGDVFTNIDSSSTECAFQARTINSTLQQRIDIRRYERLIQRGLGKVYIEMQDKIENFNPSIPSVYMNVRFFDSQNNEVDQEKSSLDAIRFIPPLTFISSLPCPSTTVELQLTLVFREVNAIADNIYVTIE